MYIDGHERDDVVAYWNMFVHQWVEYETRFQIWDDNGNPLPCPFNSCHLILVTHDESTFFQNDERKTCWNHQDSRPAPKPKSEGQLLMVLDFLMAKWGCLCDDNRFFFLFFLIALSIDHPAERPTLCSDQGRIMMDTSMWRHSSPRSIVWLTSLRARQMALPRASSCSTTHPVTWSMLMMPSLPPRWSKVRLLFFFFNIFCLIDISWDLKHLWTHHPKGPCMRNGVNPLTGKWQSFYFPENHPSHLGWFKGMEQIIHKCGLWPEAGLPVECAGPKHPEGQASCCCRHLLYSQPDFTSQKLMLQEHIESHSHLCNYYPKYYCELNFIKQYWGTAKLQFCIAGHARTLEKMKRKMLGCLDDIPLEQIQRCIAFPFFYSSTETLCRFANRSVHFIFAYHQGLSGAQAVWANKKYHGHCILPPDMIALMKEMVPK